MDGNLLQDRIELLEFKPVGGVLSVLLCDIPGSAGHAAGFVLGTLKNDLLSVAF